MQDRRNVDFISVDPIPSGVLLELKAGALEEVANPVVITNQTGTVICANPTFEQLTGCINAEICGTWRRMMDPVYSASKFLQEAGDVPTR
jgi:nitrogen-specific signal transduction histidine kinase